MTHTRLDWERRARTGLPEVIFAQSKTVSQLRDIIAAHAKRQAPALLTRLTDDHLRGLRDMPLHFDETARTATLNALAPPADAPNVGVVTAGTSDMPVAAEACAVAAFLGLNQTIYTDLGVAGLWRLQERLDEVRAHPVLIAVAGMEGALFSVLAGLVEAPVIAVPTSVGYGVSAGGQAALSSALATCAPGVMTVNIDNGFGAAAAAAKILLHTR